MAGNYAPNYYGGSGGKYPPPSHVLAGVAYGPSNNYTGTAPESEKSAIPFLVRGDDRNTSSRLIETIVSAPSDAGSVGSCSAVFAGYHDEFKTGWKVTGGTVEDLGGGLWKLKSTLTSADTLTCRPGCGYRWTHTLLDASGNIRTQQHGVTDLIDGYTVDRYSA